MAQTPIYSPSPGFRTNLDDFREYVNRKHNLKLEDYHQLHDFSTTRLNDFWLSVWSYTGIKASVQPKKAIDDNAQIDKFPKFFEDARLNFAENLLCGDDDRTAVIELSETNIDSPRRYTWKQLKELVARYAEVLQRLGLKQGEVVVVVGGNCTRSLALLLATASLGAIVACFATDIGEKSLIDRVGQLQPRVIFAELSYRYNGKLNDITDKITNCLDVISKKGKCQLITTEDGRRIPQHSKKLDDLINHSTTAADLRFAQVPFDTPFVVMFSSGTTGTPKGIVHGQGGLMINGIKEHKLHNNFGPDDIHFHYSGIGWTLWNISMGAMFCKTAMVLYDGSPFHPDPDTLLKALFATGVTGYGGSPRYFSELQKRNVQPRKYATKMHTLLSTGALLTPGTASWLAESFGPVCQIGFSGGTELCGNFMTGTRSLPCYPGEIAVKELGMDVDVFDAHGKSVPDGQAGELVCKKPFPNMPVMLWNDPDRKRYRKSYFEGYPGVWTHGDLIRINPTTKGIYVLGRSDGVLNPSGVRFGTSELYNILSQPQFSSIVLDGMAIGHQRNTSTYSDPTERVILFLKVAPEHSTGTPFPKDELVNRLKLQISKDLSRRHVPHFFFEVDEIPHNANGKKMEIQSRQVCNGGGEVLKQMTLTDLERGLLEKFERFYHVEKVMEEKEKGKASRESKL